MTDDWKNQAIRDAEARLNEAMNKMDEVLAQAEQFHQSLPSTALSNEQIEQIEEMVRQGKAPDEIKALQERIDNGDFTWEDVASGKVLDDESVQAAFAAGVPNMQRAKELIDEGHSVEDILNADPNRPTPTQYDDDDPPETFLR